MLFYLKINVVVYNNAMLIKYNYHTHTTRCGHAYGSDEEYILAAIKQGVKELGFSDHCPFPNVYQEGIRMDYEQLDEYISSINKLKEKYIDQIKIYVGLEAEYYHEIDDYYHKLLEKIDYLICGQHFALSEDRQVYVGFGRDDEKLAEGYTKRVIEAMESGLFKYIAHPDIILRSYRVEGPFRESIVRRICEAAERTHTPLELNMEGMRKKVEHNNVWTDDYYPLPYFWNIASEYNIDVIIGGDYHNPEDMFLDYDKYGFDFVNKFHLHLIDKVNIE